MQLPEKGRIPYSRDLSGEEHDRPNRNHQNGQPNYETIYRGVIAIAPPNNFRTNMVFLHITNEDQIRFEPRHVQYMYIFYVLTKICVVISHGNRNIFT